MAKHKGIHIATVNGQVFNLTREGWSNFLGASETQVSTGLRKYGTMQTYIDNDFVDFMRMRSIKRKFLFGGNYAGKNINVG